MKENKSKISCKRGFTLIELLVVVLIIGILAAVALPQYKKAVYKSKYVQMKIIIDSIVKAQEEIYVTTGAYTADIKQFSISVPQPKSIDDTANNVTVLEYPWGNCYIRATDSSCDNYDIDMYYQFYYLHNGRTSAGRRECGVLDINNAAAMAICKQIGNKDEPDWETNQYASWFY